MKPILAGTVLIAAVVTLLPGKISYAQEAVKQADKVIFGKVEGVSGDKLTINDRKQGRIVETAVEKNTSVVGLNKKVLKIGSVKLNDTVVVISSDSAKSASGSAKQTVKKIYLKEASASAQVKRRAISGIIKSIDGSVITLAHQIQQDRTYKFTVNNLTQVKVKGITSAKVSELSLGQRIAVVGDLDTSGNIIAKRIHVIPGLASGILDKKPSSTPSATVSPTAKPTVTATPSATPKLTPSVTASPSATLTP